MDDMLGLTNKTAVVWGGGLGMGESSALRLARAGCDVAVVDLDVERAERVTRAIQALGRRAAAFAANVTDEPQVLQTVAAAERALGPLDVMVTVVGMALFKPLLDISVEEWQTDLDRNLKSFFLPARAVARSILSGGRTGSIVGVASVSGLTAAPDHAAYGAAKAGLVNLVRSMAAEWSPAVRVNAIAPGAITTPRTQLSPGMLDIVRRHVPFQRPGTTDEIAKGALFMASDLASYVTGQTLAVDGGWMSTFLTDPKSELSR